MFSFRSESRLARPGNARARVMISPTIRSSCSYEVPCTTNCTGGFRKFCPRDGGLIGNASTPGMVENIFGASEAVISRTLRSRSPQSLNRTKEMPKFTGLGRSRPGATTTK
ncbi:hypothetical protein D3C83_49120 [compost metagenome]